MGYSPEYRLKKDHLGLEPGRQSPPLWGTEVQRGIRGHVQRTLERTESLSHLRMFVAERLHLQGKRRNIYVNGFYAQ